MEAPAATATTTKAATAAAIAAAAAAAAAPPAPLSLPLALPPRRPNSSSSDPLAKHRARLAGGAFRALNEALYTRRGAASAELLAASPGSFEQYHQGFRAATEAWPELPVERAAKDLLRLFSSSSSASPSPSASSSPPLVVDFGCGEAWLGRTLKERGVRCLSLDLVSTSADVVACDVSAGRGAVPLRDSCAEAAVFCLALMSTDYPEALREAARVLRPGGTLWVAEVRSRFAKGGGGGGEFDDGDDDESDDDGSGRFRRWQPKRKNVGSGCSSKGGKQLSNRQQQRNDQQQQSPNSPSSSRPPPREDVGPFIKAVCSLGFEHASTDDGSNRMFVVMTFRRRGGEGGGEKGKKKEREKKIKKKRRRGDDGGDGDDDDDNGGGDRGGRLVGGRGLWPSLRPCSYKKR